MGDKSAIEWTDATWNPIVGCAVVSPGCTNCYAMRVAGRMEAISIAHEAAHGGDPGPMERYRGTTAETRHGKAVWTGKVRFVPEVLTAPLRWKRPRMIFVNSMSDLFAEGVEDEWIDQIFAVMALAPQHTFQVLTKRPERAVEYFGGGPGDGWGERNAKITARSRELARQAGLELPEHWSAIGAGRTKHIWFGASAEDQRRWEERRGALLRVGGWLGHTFLSAEPLLGPIDLDCGYYRLDWVIVGGESGPGARPMHPDWARALLDQCTAAGVPFFFKQWGEWAPVPHEERMPARPQMVGPGDCFLLPDGRSHVLGTDLESPLAFEGAAEPMRRMGKKCAGRLLDGVTYDAMPARAGGPSPGAAHHPLPEGARGSAGTAA